MEEFKVLKQALELSVQKGVFSMQDVVVIHQCLKAIEDKFGQTETEQVTE